MFFAPIKPGRPPKYCSNECRRAAKEAMTREYTQSAKGKATKRKYNQSDRLKVVQKKYTQSDKGKATSREYRQSDKGSAMIRERRRSWRANPKNRIGKSVRNAIYRSIATGSKCHRTEELLDWTFAELVQHLESQFEPWMSWDNYGEWHIDHIIPIAAFNFKSPYDIDFKRCWALSNLRPLEARANLSKGAKLESAYQPALAMG